MPDRTGIPTLKSVLLSISEQLGLICGDENKIRSDLASFSQLLGKHSTGTQQKYLKDVAKLVGNCDDIIALAVYEYIAAKVCSMEKPWPILKLLLQTEEEEILKQATTLVLEMVAKDQLPLGRGLLHELARMMDLEYSPFDDGDLLSLLIATLNRKYKSGDKDGLLALLCKDSEVVTQKLAARLLDHHGGLASPDISQKILGKKAYKVLAPYLIFTRATYSDLIALSGGRSVSRQVVDCFKLAGEVHGEAMVREAIATLGWSQVNLGMTIDAYVCVDIAGNLPLWVKPGIALLFMDTETKTGKNAFLVTAHGGALGKRKLPKRKINPVDDFRRLNITHAELLGEFLDVAPLDRTKVHRIQSHLESIVKSYADLFMGVSDECMILSDVWQKLCLEVGAFLENEMESGPLSPELTRLILAFEEPKNLGAVTTLHGLKRYLHQKGLKLGFDMVDKAQSPNRTVDLLLMGTNGQQIRSQTIRYAEFEGGSEKQANSWLPYPVKIVADGLSRQLLYGTKRFPAVDVFIFGNEVHYYITFRNHPAFLRVDFSPPQRGGMLDLEYYGVSNYELDVHPNLELDAIRLLFRQLEFDVKMEGTRLFVRYDKERSNSLGDLCAHVEALFRLAPFLMDFDWVIGSLKLTGKARKLVAQQWANRFCHSGILPLKDILNDKGTGILIKSADGPTGKQEELWSGLAPYEDQYTGSIAPEFWNKLRLRLNGLRLNDHNPQQPWHLLDLENSLVNPLQEACDMGQVECLGEGLHPVHPDLFQLVHEAEYFANLLAGDPAPLAAAGLLARPLSELERYVSFKPTGFVGGIVVERATLTVRGGDLSVYAARDAHGVIRLGAFSLNSRMARHRKSSQKPWQSNALLDGGMLWDLMLSANYLARVPQVIMVDPGNDLSDLRSLAALHRPAANCLPVTGESLLQGLKSAPGRAVGRAVFGTAGRKPEDLKGSILVAQEVRPADSQFLNRSAGIISTGGAVLSHAALLAIQFGKPAVVVNAQWDATSQVTCLNFGVTVFREMESLVRGFSVCVRVIVSRRTDKLIENDLVILDANDGSVRVLGQNRDTLALWDGLHLLGEASRRVDCATSDTETLEIRAQQLRARHQIQKILDRLSDPVLTAFAVEELVLGSTLAFVKYADKYRLLSRLLANVQVATTAQIKLNEICRNLADRCRFSEGVATQQIPTAGYLYEVLGLRLRAAHWYEAMDGALVLLKECGLGNGVPVCTCQSDLSQIARDRLIDLRMDLLGQLEEGGPRARHLLRSIGRMGYVLGTPSPQADLIIESQELLAAADVAMLVNGRGKMVLLSGDCGLESHPQIGWKAANLAEIDRLAGLETVPPFFVISNDALSLMGKSSVGSAEYLGLGIHTLHEAINHVLQQENFSNKDKSLKIQKLWKNTNIPPRLAHEIIASYACLNVGTDGDSYVAVRSSSCDEDTEKNMRAGEFDSYLYVQGADSLLEHLLLTWSGLWTERALFNREAAGTMLHWPTGGVIVQRMVRARVSGVLQTVNVASGDLREMLVNVGLGLGEGIVSGLVDADLITVVKDFATGEHPVHLNYLTNDKPRQMVFDERRGKGTCLQDTLYHQRLRPALEYTELCDIVGKANVLEQAYGYPLDIEFAIEDARLWLLQARPIATFSAELQETVKSYPLDCPDATVRNQECCCD